MNKLFEIITKANRAVDLKLYKQRRKDYGEYLISLIQTTPDPFDGRHPEAAMMYLTVDSELRQMVLTTEQERQFTALRLAINQKLVELTQPNPTDRLLFEAVRYSPLGKDP
jgi:hypothetical protein